MIYDSVQSSQFAQFLLTTDLHVSCNNKLSASISDNITYQSLFVAPVVVDCWFFMTSDMTSVAVTPSFSKPFTASSAVGQTLILEGNNTKSNGYNFTSKDC